MIWIILHVSSIVYYSCYLQTRDALIEETGNSNLNIAESVGFPTQESPQNALKSLKVISAKIDID